MIQKVKYNSNGFPYYQGRPPNTDLVVNTKEFYRKIKGKVKEKPENMELKVGEYYLVQGGKDTSIYYLRIITELMDPTRLQIHINNNQIYLFK